MGVRAGQRGGVDTAGHGQWDDIHLERVRAGVMVPTGYCDGRWRLRIQRWAGGAWKLGEAGTVKSLRGTSRGRRPFTDHWIWIIGCFQ